MRRQRRYKRVPTPTTDGRSKQTFLQLCFSRRSGRVTMAYNKKSCFYLDTILGVIISFPERGHKNRSIISCRKKSAILGILCKTGQNTSLSILYVPKDENNQVSPLPWSNSIQEKQEKLFCSANQNARLPSCKRRNTNLP